MRLFSSFILPISFHPCSPPHFFTLSPYTPLTPLTTFSLPAFPSPSLPPSIPSSSQTSYSPSPFVLPLVMAEESVKVHTKGRVQHGANAEIDGDYFFFKEGSDSAVGVIKILEPMNPLLNYYEFLIVNRGQEAFIGIGVCMQLTGLPLYVLP